MTLNPWQQLAVVFMEERRHACGFAILGDEMGVGKAHAHISNC